MSLPNPRRRIFAGRWIDGVLALALIAAALFIGAPETVAAKIARVARALDLSRFDLKYSLGTLPHEKLMESLQLYANEVAPRVRRALEE